MHLLLSWFHHLSSESISEESSDSVSPLPASPPRRRMSRFSLSAPSSLNALHEAANAEEGTAFVYDEAKQEELAEAARRGDVATVTRLLKSGMVRPDHKVKPYGWTALHNAAREGKIETMKVLIDFGANVNVLDDMMQTPLHRATQHGHRICAEYLLSKKADPTIQDQFKQTALHLAQSLNQQDFIAVLQKYVHAAEKRKLEQLKKEKKAREEHEKKLREEQRRLLKLEEKRHNKTRRGSDPPVEDKGQLWLDFINGTPPLEETEEEHVPHPHTTGRRWSVAY